MNTLENNKLIALFMGAYVGNPVGKTEVICGVPSFFAPHLTDTHATKDLQYHKMWSWLMPVVERIESLKEKAHYPYIKIKGEYCEIDTLNNVFCLATHGKTKLEAVYNIVTLFIEWYNQLNLKS